MAIGVAEKERNKIAAGIAILAFFIVFYCGATLLLYIKQCV